MVSEYAVLAREHIVRKVNKVDLSHASTALRSTPPEQRSLHAMVNSKLTDIYRGKHTGLVAQDEVERYVAQDIARSENLGHITLSQPLPGETLHTYIDRIIEQNKADKVPAHFTTILQRLLQTQEMPSPRKEAQKERLRRMNEMYDKKVSRMKRGIALAKADIMKQELLSMDKRVRENAFAVLANTQAQDPEQWQIFLEEFDEARRDRIDVFIYNFGEWYRKKEAKKRKEEARKKEQEEIESIRDKLIKTDNTNV